MLVKTFCYMCGCDCDPSFRRHDNLPVFCSDDCEAEYRIEQAEFIIACEVGAAELIGNLCGFEEGI